MRKNFNLERKEKLKFLKKICSFPRDEIILSRNKFRAFEILQTYNL